jgi:hypothetical protein
MSINGADSGADALMMNIRLCTYQEGTEHCYEQRNVLKEALSAHFQRNVDSHKQQ